MIRVLCNHRFIPRNGIIGSGAFFIFERNSERIGGIGNLEEGVEQFSSILLEIVRDSYRADASKTKISFDSNRVLNIE